MPEIPESREVWEYGQREFDRIDEELSRICKLLYVAVLVFIVSFTLWLIL